MQVYYFWFFLFIVIAYFIVTDESVAKLFNYASKLLQFQYEKTKWWVIHNPKTPWARYLIHRRSIKLAEDLIKNIESKSK